MTRNRMFYVRLAVMLVCCVLIVLAAGCGSDPPLTEGRVTDRAFVAAHTEQYQRAVPHQESYVDEECSGIYDSLGHYVGETCHPVTRIRTVYIYVPDERLIPDEWTLRISFCEEDDDGERHCRQQTREVSQAHYDDCEIGEYWREDTACAPR